jgi:hypothetical protein
MMELVPGVRHVRLTNETAIPTRIGIEVDDAERVRTPVVQRIDEYDIGERLRW